MVSIESNRAPAGREVRFSIANVGDATATAVRVVGRLIQDGEVVETNWVTIESVPRHSSRWGSIAFDRNPADFRVELLVAGYVDP